MAIDSGRFSTWAHPQRKLVPALVLISKLRQDDNACDILHITCVSYTVLSGVLIPLGSAKLVTWRDSHSNNVFPSTCHSFCAREESRLIRIPRTPGTYVPDVTVTIGYGDQFGVRYDVVPFLLIHVCGVVCGVNRQHTLNGERSFKGAGMIRVGQVERLVLWS